MFVWSMYLNMYPRNPTVKKQRSSLQTKALSSFGSISTKGSTVVSTTALFLPSSWLFDGRMPCWIFPSAIVPMLPILYRKANESEVELLWSALRREIKHRTGPNWVFDQHWYEGSNDTIASVMGRCACLLYYGSRTGVSQPTVRIREFYVYC